MNNQQFTVFAVDDDPMIQDILHGILAPHYDLQVFASAEACQAGMAAVAPDCLLLDIGLPGMDGYQFCRQLKNDEMTQGIPVTFISSHDTIDARLQGYDAGGEDFIVKPFSPEELLRKLKVSTNIVATQQSLRAQARASEELTTLALASMDDSSIMLQFMSKLIGWYDEKEIADGILNLLRQFGLEGVVQADIGERSYVVSRTGSNLPLESSILKHVRTLGRIFEFRDRAVFNHERVTIMVNHMPLEDSALCGRIRDNLAIGAQGAAARLEALENEAINHDNQASIVEAVNAIEGTLDALTMANLQNRYQTSQLIYQFEEELSRSFVGLGLSDDQERQIEASAGQFTRQLVEQMDQTESLQHSLETLSHKLHQLRR